MKNDTISRKDAIDAIFKTCRRTCSLSHALEKVFEQLPSVQSEQTKMIKEIRKWINSGNRGSADYFIVDKIAEIINKYEE